MTFLLSAVHRSHVILLMLFRDWLTAMNGVVGFKDGINVGLKVGLYETVGSYEIVGNTVGCATGIFVGRFVGFWVGWAS